MIVLAVLFGTVPLGAVALSVRAGRVARESSTETARVSREHRTVGAEPCPAGAQLEGVRS